ncbi:sensor histidine kinase [Lacrimispora sp.]|uniref:sensor histidine kinase n=1 Tax=Lacrimispora sp. TaxID=2719234 RepID=UPI0032E48B97
MSKKRFMDIFTKIRVQKQLYLFFFIAIFIPITTVGSYLIYLTRTQLFDHYSKQTYSDNLRVKSLILDLTENIYNKSQILVSDQNLITLLTTRYSADSESKSAISTYKGIDTLLSGDASLHGISVYTFNSTIADSPHIHPITDNLQNQPWYKRASSSVTPFWTVELEKSERYNTEVQNLCLYTRIFLPQVHSYAILKLTVSNNHIRSRIENSSMHTVIWLNDSSIFYTSDRQVRTPGLERYAGGGGSSCTGTYQGKIALENGTVIGCVSSLSPAYCEDSFYMASLSYDGYPYLNRISSTYLAILALVLIITSMFICVFSHYFSLRIITLRECMHRASQGNYEIADNFHGEDEISDVFSDLKLMIHEILEKETSVYQAQLKTRDLINKQQQMEFKMLSSQINPHFLYNTLETIRMRSLKAGNLEVANAIKLLGKSMRYVLENTSTSATSLSRELDYIETYLSIQKLRFHDRVNYSLKISPQLDPEDYQIMPLLLQPIVENALLHGLEEVEQNGKIILKILLINETLCIYIYDNGCGMTPEELKLLNQSIHRPPNNSSHGIGLYNINQRIQLYYGFEYGLTIKCKKSMGTLVTMVIPVQNHTGGN